MRPLRITTGAAAALSIAVLLAHAWTSIQRGYDVNLVSGVWLALAQDLGEGLFYRDLIGSSGYGGSRYFPLFFSLISLVNQTGAGLVAAGWIVSIAGLVVLAAGVLLLMRALGVSGVMTVAYAALATGAYFVQQSAFAIRVDPLAAGLAFCGLACVARGLYEPRNAGRWIVSAAACFTLGITAKPTAAYALAAAVAAMIVRKQWSGASLLAGVTAAATVFAMFVIDWLSAGRFLESIRATAFAGGSFAGLFSSYLPPRLVGVLAASRLLTVILIVSAAGLASRPRSLGELPGLVLIAAAAAAAISLGSPGTISTNQLVDLYAASAVFLGWFFSREDRLHNAGLVLAAVFLAWTSAQNVARIRTIQATAPDAGLVGRTVVIRQAFERCQGSVLAESPLAAVLGGMRPIVLDPFAFRTVSLARPDVSRDLVSRLERHEFGCVVLEYDPADDRGRAWYREVHFGEPVAEALRQQYRYRESAGTHRIYVPASE